MPHKTRKEKIIAELRRKLAVQSKHSTNTQAFSEIKEETKARTSQDNSFVSKPYFVKKISDNSAISLSLVSQDYHYILTDLKKTSILTIFVLIIEFVLYWALELGGIRSFNFIFKR